MGGWDLVRAIRKDPRLRELPVVALTTVELSRDLEEDARIFDAYRNKIDRRELVDTIALLLDNQTPQTSRGTG